VSRHGFARARKPARVPPQGPRTSDDGDEPADYFLFVNNINACHAARRLL